MVHRDRWRREIDAECVRLAFSHLPGVALAALVTSSVISVVVRDAVDRNVLAIWVAAVWLNAGARLVLAWRFRSRKPADEALRAWWWALFVSMGIAGSVFGSLAMLPAGEPPILLVAVLALAIGGHIAGGAQSLVATPPILAISAVTSCAPLAYTMLTARAPEVQYLSIMVAAYLAATLVMARTNYRAIRASLTLRYENLELVAELARKRTIEADARALAEAAGRDKTRFLAAASHDLRQPLHALALFASALGGEPQTARGAHLLGRVTTAVEALQTLLDALLDISRHDAGVVQARPRHVECAALQRQLDALFSIQARERGLRLRVPATDLAVHTDPDLIGQILRNLVSNAIRYTPHGGVLVAFRRRGSRVRVEVYDTGVGIPASEHERIFREFYQVGNPERDRTNGVGLGLAIVARIAKLLETTIEVTSVVGRGTRFAFDLPLSADAIAAPAAAPPGESPRACGRVLLVDDDVLAREAITAVLEAWGFTVTAARDVESARTVASCEAFDLAIVDFRLPGERSGLDALAAIGSAAPRALIITGETDPAQIVRAHETPHPVLHKPVKPEALRATLDRLLA